MRHALLLWIAALAMLAGAGGCALIDAKQRELIFRPSRELSNTPASWGLAFEEVWLKVASDDASQRVYGWWIPAADPLAPAMLYLHGSRWNIGNNLSRIARLHQMGYAVLAIDYRGFGRSDGELPSESQAYEDADAGWEELKRRVTEPGRRLIYGHSLGGAVAIDLAVRRPEAAALIVESTFTSIADMVSSSPYWFIPAGLILTQHFDSLAKIGRLKIPIMFVYGTADRFVPPSMSERLYAAANTPKRLLRVEGAGHSNASAVAYEKVHRALADFATLARSRYRASGLRRAPSTRSASPRWSWRLSRSG
jgi:pimeloyl-ACP methyl ester carboxylesterase